MHSSELTFYLKYRKTYVCPWGLPHVTFPLNIETVSIYSRLKRWCRQSQSSINSFQNLRLTSVKDLLNEFAIRSIKTLTLLKILKNESTIFHDDGKCLKQMMKSGDDRINLSSKSNYFAAKLAPNFFWIIHTTSKAVSDRVIEFQGGEMKNCGPTHYLKPHYG